MSLPYKGNLIPLARNLRKNATPQEKRLWYEFLRKYPARFQRQKTIGNYIVDFYCHSAKLVIELDGSQHYTEKGEEYDSKRDAFLREQGLTVIRISNLDVDRNFIGVCDYIDKITNNSLSQLC